MEQKFLDEFFEELDFYNESSIEENLEDDEISAYEEGFMVGYLR